MKSNNFNNSINIIGAKLKKNRELQKISQEELCNKLALLGITLYKNDIYRIEKNKRVVKDFELWGIAKCLNVKIEDLIDIKEEKGMC